MRALRSLSLFALILGSGCRDATPRSAGAAPPEVRDSMGVRIVENPFPGAAELSWELRPVAVLGDPRDGAPFAEIRAVDVAPDGSILVLDRGDGRVTVWSPDGVRRGTFGGRGSGPGEVVTPGYTRALSDGRFVIGEVFPPRLHWYDGSGRYLETERVRPAPDAPPVLATMAQWRVTRSGDVFVRLSHASPSHVDGTPVVLGTLGPSGTLDTLARWTERTTPARLPRIFEADWSWDVDPERGAVVSPGARYELRRLDRTGALVEKVRLGTPRVRVTEELERRALDRFYERFSGEDVSEAVLRDLRDRLEVAPHLPAVQGIRVSESDGTMWVEAPTRERSGEVEEPGAWDVFGADGRYLGRLRPPAGFRLEGVRGDLLFGIERDTLGVTRARVYRVVRRRSSG